MYVLLAIVFGPVLVLALIVQLRRANYEPRFRSKPEYTSLKEDPDSPVYLRVRNHWSGPFKPPSDD